MKSKQKIAALELLIERIMLTVINSHLPEDEDGVAFIDYAIQSAYDEAHQDDYCHGAHPSVIADWLDSRKSRLLLIPEVALRK